MYDPQGIFVSAYWISMVLYLVLVGTIHRILPQVEGLPDFRMSRASPAYRWLPLYVHTLVAFMPLVNVILLCVTVFLIARSVYKHYLGKKNGDSFPIPPL